MEESEKIPAPAPSRRGQGLRWGVVGMVAAVLVGVAAVRGTPPRNRPEASALLKLDTSSDEAFQVSLQGMTAGLSYETKREFADALVKLAQPHLGSKPTLSASLRPLQGLTVDQIIARAKETANRREGGGTSPPTEDASIAKD